MTIMIAMITTGGWQPLCVGVPPREDVERSARDGFAPSLQVITMISIMMLMIKMVFYSFDHCDD